MSGTVTAFLDGKIVAAGSRDTVTRALEERYPASDHAAIRVFDDRTGKVTDLDLWDAAAMVARAALDRAGAQAKPLRTEASGQLGLETPRGRGRPKLGVQAREVTLLPRHWEWLGQQPGGASAALRRLVEEARKSGSDRREAAYYFLQASCGDRPGYEEALRAVYRGDRAGLDEIAADWPEDMRGYLARLLDG